MESGEGEVTRRLRLWAEGDAQAVESLVPLIYTELHRIADGYLRHERAGHLLQPTALVNEAWLKMAGQEHLHFENRRRFFALAAHAMRQVLVDYARSAQSGKRGGGAVAIPLAESLAAPDAGLEQFLALDRALTQLATISPRGAEVIEMRYFAGLNVEEAASFLNVSPATISREQRSAEAWLYHAMSTGARKTACP